MTRAAGFCSLFLFVLASASCESSVAPGEVELVGRWDGVGALQTSADGYGISLYIQTHAGGNGPLTGSWRRNGEFLSQGSIAEGTVQDGDITFRLSGFPGTDPTFAGRLTSKHRLAGEFDALALEGAAVFRRGSITP
jgi:hypothetical protein